MNVRNEWEPVAYTQNELIAYSPEDSGALYRWLNRTLDLQKLFAEKQAGQLGELLMAIGVAVWVDVVELGKCYILRPDLLPVQKYKR